MSTSKNEKHVETRYIVAYRREHDGMKVVSAEWEKHPKSWRLVSGDFTYWPDWSKVQRGELAPGSPTRVEALAAGVRACKGKVMRFMGQIDTQHRASARLHALLPEMEALDAKDAEANR